MPNDCNRRCTLKKKPNELGKNPLEWVLADMKNNTSFHMFKNQHYSKRGKTF